MQYNAIKNNLYTHTHTHIIPNSDIYIYIYITIGKSKKMLTNKSNLCHLFARFKRGADFLLPFYSRKELFQPWSQVHWSDYRRFRKLSYYKLQSNARKLDFQFNDEVIYYGRNKHATV